MISLKDFYYEFLYDFHSHSLVVIMILVDVIIIFIVIVLLIRDNCFDDVMITLILMNLFGLSFSLR